MAQPKPRYDAYARPLPPLSEAHHEVLIERPFNVQQRRNLVLLLEELHRDLLRRGMYAEVTLRYIVKDGVIMEDIQIGAIRTVVCPRET